MFAEKALPKVEVFAGCCVVAEAPNKDVVAAGCCAAEFAAPNKPVEGVEVAVVDPKRPVEGAEVVRRAGCWSGLTNSMGRTSTPRSGAQ